MPDSWYLDSLLSLLFLDIFVLHFSRFMRLFLFLLVPLLFLSSCALPGVQTEESTDNTVSYV